MNTVKLSISPQPYPGKIQQNDREAWANLYRNLVHVELDAAGMADALYKGHIIAPVLDGWRSYSHFIEAQHIGIDMDTEDKRSAMSTLIDHDLVQMYGAIVYATPSSTPTTPRSRVIFLLDKPIDNPYSYKAAIKTVSRYFPGFDRNSAEATRTFFGNAKLVQTHNSDGMYFSDSRLPVADLRAMYAAQKREDERTQRPAVDYTQHDLNIDNLVQKCIGKAAPGQRNGLCYWMACRLVENGVPDTEQEQAVSQYANGVSQTGHVFDVREAMACLKSARMGVAA